MEKIYIAIIAALSALLGATIPELFKYLNQKRVQKKELNIKYLSKIENVYGEIFNFFSTIHKVNQSLEMGWRDKRIETERLIIKHGIWIGKDEFELMKQIESKLSDYRILIELTKEGPEKFSEIERKRYEEIKDNNDYMKGLDLLIEDLLDICRKKILSIYSLN